MMAPRLSRFCFPTGNIPLPVHSVLPFWAGAEVGLRAWAGARMRAWEWTGAGAVALPVAAAGKQMRAQVEPEAVEVAVAGPRMRAWLRTVVMGVGRR